MSITILPSKCLKKKSFQLFNCLSWAFKNKVIMSSLYTIMLYGIYGQHKLHFLSQSCDGGSMWPLTPLRLRSMLTDLIDNCMAVFYRDLYLFVLI